MTSCSSGHDLAWAARDDLLFQALDASFAISVPGLSGAMKDRPIEPYWAMLDQVMTAVAALPHQRLRGVDADTWRRIRALFDQIDLFDATQVALPPTLAEWAETAPEKSGFKLQLKLDGTCPDGRGRFKEALITKPSGNDNAHFADLLALEEGAGALYVFDCGYFNIERYHEITRTGNYFVTKLHGNIAPEVVTGRPVTGGGHRTSGHRTSAGTSR